MSINPLKYQPTKLNTAQRLLIALGVDDLRLVAHERTANPSFTKKGPGRKHQQCKARDTDTKPITQADVMAQPGLFLGQHTNKAKNERRALVKAAGGIRQLKRIEREQRALQKYWADPMRWVEMEAEAPLLQD